MAGGASKGLSPEEKQKRIDSIKLGRDAIAKSDFKSWSLQVLHALQLVTSGLQELEVDVNPSKAALLQNAVGHILHSMFKLLFLAQAMPVATDLDQIMILPTVVSRSTSIELELVKINVKPIEFDAGFFESAIDNVKSSLTALGLLDERLLAAVDDLIRQEGDLNSKVALMREVFAAFSVVGIDRSTVTEVERLLSEGRGSSLYSKMLFLTKSQWDAIQGNVDTLVSIMRAGVSKIEVRAEPPLHRRASMWEGWLATAIGSTPATTPEPTGES